MTYPSKKDWWVVPVLLAGLVLSAVGGLVLWAYCSTSYDITPPNIIVRFSPLRWTIPLEGITQVERKKGMSPDWAWGEAWSLDRVVIKYRKRNGRMALLGVAVAPEDKDGFLRELAEALPGLQRSGGAERKAVGHRDAWE